jgi:SprB repeat
MVAHFLSICLFMKSFNFSFFLLFFIFTFNLQAQTTLWHVDSAVIIGTHSGLNWSNAINDLQIALNLAEEGDTIWVANGTYRPDSASDRSRRFELKNGVRFLGGFSGNETAENQRNWQTNRTILSGDIGILGDSLDNSFTILYLENPDSSTIVDGFIFKNGQADNQNPNLGSKSAGKCGAALYLMGYDGFAYADIKNCVFEHNYAFNHGGAVFVNGGGFGSVAPRFLNCIFRNNVARKDGGAVYRDGGSWAERSPDFGGCDFNKNISFRYGGGLFYEESERTDKIELDSSYLNFNKAISNTTVAGGGGICLQLGRQVGSNFKISNSSFIQNFSSNDGLQLLVLDFTALYTDSFEIKNCFFEGDKNSVSVFHSIEIVVYNFNGFQNKFTRCVINGLKSTKTSSFVKPIILASFDRVGFSNATIESSAKVSIFNNGLFIRYENITFSNGTDDAPDWNIDMEANANFICKNLYIIGKRYKNSSAMFNKYQTTSNADTKFINCAFIKNVFTGIADSNANSIRKVSFQNCLFSTDFNQKVKNFDQQTSVTYQNCAFHTLDTVNLEPHVILAGGNLIGLDPQFRDTANGDYRLAPCSPLINAGTNIPWLNNPNATDLAGRPRIQNGAVDIGAYETGIGFMPISTQSTSCAGAKNGSATFAAEACPPLAWAWSGGAGADTVVTNLPAGTWPITFTDAHGFSQIDTVQIGAGAPLDYSLGIGNVACFGDSTGSVSISLDLATQPIDYQWNTGETTANITNISVGNYAVTATDALGCSASATAQITQPNAPINFVGKVQSATGATKSDGEINADSTTGGTSPYQYLWSNGQTGSSASSLLPGNYMLTLTDFNGCQDTFHFVVDWIISVSDLDFEVEFQLSPNPARAGEPVFLKFLTPENKNLRLEITDVVGKIVQKNNLENESIFSFTAPKTKGSYFLTLISEIGKRKSIRWVVY